MELVTTLFDIGRRLLLVAVAMASILSVAYFPWSSDKPLTAAEQAELQKFYKTAYQQPAVEEKQDTEYVRIAETQADQQDVKGNVLKFARENGLLDKKVLDIGAGRGYLQDVVTNYTALDISPSVKRFFHKSF